MSNKRKYVTMSQLTISEVARAAGLRPSAIRYYESIGILQPVERVGGKRRYDRTAVYRLALVRRAQETGFSLDKIRKLFFGFRQSTPISERWRKLSERKLAELEEMEKQIQHMQAVLRKLRECCTCESIDQCGRGIFEGGCDRENSRFLDFVSASATRSLRSK